MAKSSVHFVHRVHCPPSPQPPDPIAHYRFFPMTTVETRNPTILEEIASQRVAVDERAGIAWLAKSRKEALARFRELGLPTTDIEEWRFTNVTRLAGQ